MLLQYSLCTLSLIHFLFLVVHIDDPEDLLNIHPLCVCVYVSVLARLRTTAVPTSIHCDHLIVANKGPKGIGWEIAVFQIVHTSTVRALFLSSYRFLPLYLFRSAWRWSLRPSERTFSTLRHPRAHPLTHNSFPEPYEDHTSPIHTHPIPTQRTLLRLWRATPRFWSSPTPKR